ncbi:putative Glycosyl transferase, family 9 [Nitrospira japonica]|uniref:Putative Glycosyl transferase, family 9 n=1 Tax=Nitrospira japonica TaxID=1325564 RepID=A0A1W1I080_9BACT|nr:glycosyltransferase family 9 protein [Nitrospira japonica]SLM46299.1 putative Glycosyl transferase, family 9 [Nitrospira japonica]
MIRTVVIIHPGALGDVLLAVPAIVNLRRKFPRHEFVLCADRRIGELLRDCGLVDGWMPAQGFGVGQLFGGYVEAGSVMSNWLARCELAVAWVRDEGEILEEVLRRYVQGTVAVCSPFSPRLSSVHQSDRFWEALDEVARDSVQPVVLQLPRGLRELGRTRLREANLDPDRRIVLLHPGSGSRSKCAKAEIFAEVIHGLRRDGLGLALLEGPADHATVVEVSRLVREERIGILRDLNLGLLAGVLASADLFVGHDSGASHLSASVGTETITLFGPTVAERWAPRGGHVTVMKADACRCPNWEAVGHCVERPCLNIPPHTLLDMCRQRLVRHNSSKIHTKRLVSH